MSTLSHRPVLGEDPGLGAVVTPTSSSSTTTLGSSKGLTVIRA